MDIEVLDPIKFEPAEEYKASLLRLDIDLTLNEIKHNHLSYLRGFTHLGNLLLEAKSKRYWHLWGHPTFGNFIKSIHDDIALGRTQIYNAISVAERLLPLVSVEDVEAMGITKANVLAQMVRHTGRRPSEALVTKAANHEIGVSELRAAVFEESRLKIDHQPGKYRDLGGIYATDEEWDEIQRGFKSAAYTDPALPNELPAFVKTKEVLLRLVQEFWSTYGSEENP